MSSDPILAAGGTVPVPKGPLWRTRKQIKGENTSSAAWWPEDSRLTRQRIGVERAHGVTLGRESDDSLGPLRANAGGSKRGAHAPPHCPAVSPAHFLPVQLFYLALCPDAQPLITPQQATTDSLFRAMEISLLQMGADSREQNAAGDAVRVCL